MFRFYKDQSIAEDVEQILTWLHIPVEIECPCTKDHGLSQCLDIGSSCREGVYLTVADKYSTILGMLTDQMAEKRWKYEIRKN